MNDSARSQIFARIRHGSAGAQAASIERELHSLGTAPAATPPCPELCTAFLASWVIGLFQATIEQVVALAVLMPIVASMGGIAGSQTLTLVIRGIATGQVGRSNSRLLLTKELAVGFLNGMVWAIVVAIVVVLWFKDIKMGGIIATAMAANLICAALAGVTIPIILRKLKIDPALAGGVVLTTITDVIGIFAFLGLATWLLI